MIQLKKISKSFNTQNVLDQFDIAFDEGKTYTIIGQSGCGKSTLIRIIAGLVDSDTGEVFISSEKLTKLNIQSIRKKIGYVIQDGGLFPHLTAKQNLELQARYFNFTEDKVASRIEELITLTKFSSELLEKYPLQLSGGEKQRVAIMRALMLDPDILLLDEPLGALDPIIRSGLQSELKIIFTELNKTVLLVTHDLNEAAYFADEIILLRNGKIEQKDSVQQFFQNPRTDYVRIFINAQMGVQIN